MFSLLHSYYTISYNNKKHCKGTLRWISLILSWHLPVNTHIIFHRVFIVIMFLFLSSMLLLLGFCPTSKADVKTSNTFLILKLKKKLCVSTEIAYVVCNKCCNICHLFSDHDIMKFWLFINFMNDNIFSL